MVSISKQYFQSIWSKILTFQSIFQSLQGNKGHLDCAQGLFTTISSTYIIGLVRNFNLLPDNICFWTVQKMLRPFDNDLNIFFHIIKVSLPITVTVNCPISANAITNKNCKLDWIPLHIKRKLEIKQGGDHTYVIHSKSKFMWFFLTHYSLTKW